VPGLSLLVTQEFDSLARIELVNEPILLIHGTQDPIIPHEMADQLAAAVGGLAQPMRRVVKVDGASHWGVPMVAGATYDRAVREFLAAAAPAAAAIAAGAPAMAR
jgi:fermentation-respiration switch protein FrsA (DUF1100 family)